MYFTDILQTPLIFLQKEIYTWSFFCKPIATFGPWPNYNHIHRSSIVLENYMKKKQQCKIVKNPKLINHRMSVKESNSHGHSAQYRALPNITTFGVIYR